MIRSDEVRKELARSSGETSVTRRVRQGPRTVRNGTSGRTTSACAAPRGSSSRGAACSSMRAFARKRADGFSSMPPTDGGSPSVLLLCQADPEVVRERLARRRRCLRCRLGDSRGCRRRNGKSPARRLAQSFAGSTPEGAGRRRSPRPSTCSEDLGCWTLKNKRRGAIENQTLEISERKECLAGS